MYFQYPAKADWLVTNKYLLTEYLNLQVNDSFQMLGFLFYKLLSSLCDGHLWNPCVTFSPYLNTLFKPMLDGMVLWAGNAPMERPRWRVFNRAGKIRAQVLVKATSSRIVRKTAVLPGLGTSLSGTTHLKLTHTNANLSTYHLLMTFVIGMMGNVALNAVNVLLWLVDK